MYKDVRKQIVVKMPEDVNWLQENQSLPSNMYHLNKIINVRRQHLS